MARRKIMERYFRITKLPDGAWGEPENLGNVINTELDEDYPFLNHDWKNALLLQQRS